jgi:hypothetical protein
MADVVRTAPVIVDTSCKWVKPILLSIDEVVLIEKGVISRETAAQILAHNETYARHCKKTK